MTNPINCVVANYISGGVARNDRTKVSFTNSNHAPQDGIEQVGHGYTPYASDYLRVDSGGFEIIVVNRHVRCNR
ncbi:MAG: hypothetical protein E2O37_07105 [Proteobacteria bacterium]|nr:MAG: hypothetical protein E2O37_07105 [Pseudomonadota bacterium]